jgi:hypothetical protein
VLSFSCVGVAVADGSLLADILRLSQFVKKLTGFMPTAFAACFLGTVLFCFWPLFFHLSNCEYLRGEMRGGGYERRGCTLRCTYSWIILLRSKFWNWSIQLKLTVAVITNYKLEKKGFGEKISKIQKNPKKFQ